MKKEKKEKMVKIPVLTKAELSEYGKLMIGDATEEEKEAFWDEIYKKRGINRLRSVK